MINLKEHFKLTTLYTFFAAFPALLQLIVYPVIEGESRLGATDFGYLAITEAIISIAFIICTFGMGNGIARYYYDHKDNKKAYNRLVSTVVGSIIGRGLILMGVVLIFAPVFGTLFSQPALQEFGKYGPSLIIAGFNRSIYATLIALYRNEKRLKVFVIVSLVSGISRSLFQLVGVLFFDMSFLGYVHGTAVGGSILSVGLIIFTYYKCGFHYNRQILRDMFPFIRPLFFTDLLLWGILFADRFFLLSTPANLGIYDNAMKFAIGVQLIVQGLTNAVQPEFYRYLKEGISGRVKEIKTIAHLFIAEAIIVTVLLIIPVMLFITAFYETDLRLSAGLIGIVFVRYILTAQQQVFAIPIMYAKRTRIFFYLNSGVLALNLALNWWLTPRIGYYGAIIAFFSAYTIQVLLFSVMQQKYIPIKWNRVKVLYFPLSVVLFAFFIEGLKLITGINPFITTSLFVVVTLSGLIALYRNELMGYLELWVQGRKNNP